MKAELLGGDEPRAGAVRRVRVKRRPQGRSANLQVNMTCWEGAEAQRHAPPVGTKGEGTEGPSGQEPTANSQQPKRGTPVLVATSDPCDRAHDERVGGVLRSGKVVPHAVPRVYEASAMVPVVDEGVRTVEVDGGHVVERYAAGVREISFESEMDELAARERRLESWGVMTRAPTVAEAVVRRLAELPEGLRRRAIGG